MKTAELAGAKLDYWVAKADHWFAVDGMWFRSESGDYDISMWKVDAYSPSTNWGQGGPIIEREHGTFTAYYGAGGKLTHYAAEMGAGMNSYWMPGPTHLVAAMRAYVASKFGDEVADEPA